MEQTLILKNIGRHITLNDEEISYFTGMLTCRQVNKKEFVLKEGQTCRYINFVNSGALRAYHADVEGNESVIIFAISDWCVTDMYAFTTQQPDMLYIEAMED